MRIFAIIVSLSMLGIAGIVGAHLPSGAWQYTHLKGGLAYAKSDAQDVLTIRCRSLDDRKRYCAQVNQEFR